MEENMSKIRIHKEINLLPIKMGKENLINVFYGLLEKYNRQIEYEPLEVSKSELWSLAGFKGDYNYAYIQDLIRDLTTSNTYNVNSIDSSISTISGSMFIITHYPDGGVKINVPEDFRKLIFYKKDIDLMTKAKHKKKLTIQELDYWDREGKQKSKFLVLLKKADILGIKGKYNKRLYALLTQFNKTGVYISKWEIFKEILEIPNSYKASNIEQRVFSKARKELLKVGIEITKITKIKKGRSIDRIEMFFKTDEKIKYKRLQSVEPCNELLEELKTDKRGSIDLELIRYKKEILEIAKIKYKNNYKLRSKINGAESLDILEKLIQEHDLAN